MATEATETVDKKVEVPERIWISPSLPHLKWVDYHYDGGVEYARISAPNTRQRAERAARKIFTEILGSEHLRWESAIADIIAAEFEKQ